MTYCVALDPGGTTGMALVREEHQPWRIETYEFTGAHYLDLHRALASLLPKHIVCEAFDNRADEAAKIVSAEYIGVVKCYVQMTKCDLIMQHVSSVKGFWSSEKLQDYGLWTVGQKHARDAIRHYAYWRMFKCGDKSVLERKTTPFVLPLAS